MTRAGKHWAEPCSHDYPRNLDGVPLSTRCVFCGEHRLVTSLRAWWAAMTK